MKYSDYGKTFGWVAICAGAILLVSAFFIPDTNARIVAIFLGTGIALFPAGFFIILSDINYSNRTKQQIESALNSSTKALANSMDSSTEALSGSINSLKDAIEFLNKTRSLGIAMGYKNREEGLDKFLQHLESYVSNPAIHNKEFVFVGSSLKGLLETKDFGERISKMITEAGDSDDGTDFYFLLTHPAYSRYREVQEDRAPGDIAKEILHAISWLAHKNIPKENVKVYKGTPTCFLMASTEKMLINPYPYEIEAYKCFCLELINNDESESIYKSYIENHFYKPWKGQEHDRDHYKQPSALSYSWDYFDGPICSDAKEKRCSNHPMCDVLFVDDKASFYIAVNISTLEKQIAYLNQQGETKILNVGDTINICMLSREGDEWDCVGQIKLGDARRGFWHGTITDKAMSAYKYIGLLDGVNTNPLCLDLPVKENEGLLFWKEVPLEIVDKTEDSIKI